MILQRQSREDGRIRWWAYAWVCRAFALVPLLPLPSTQPSLSIHFLSATAGIASNICLILSSPALRHDKRQMYLASLGLGLPAFAFTAYVFFGNGARWPLYVILAVGFVAGAAVAAVRFRTETRRLAALSLVIAFDCVAIAAAVAKGDRSGALSLVFVQLLAINLLMFWWNNTERIAGLYVTLSGFIIWIASSPAVTHFSHRVLLIGGVVIGERIVGVGMIMILVQESLQRARQLTVDLEALFAQSPHMMWVVDPETMMLSRANQAAADAHGYSLEEFQRLRLQDIVHPGTFASVSDGIRQSPRATPASLHVRKDGSVFPVDIEARNILIGGRNERLIMGIDVTEREALLKQLAYEASHDYLTGLYSRRGMMAQEPRVFEDSRSHGKGVAVASIGLRQFKAVNDTYGDDTGDRCLQILAGRITGFVRACDLAGRTSGDRFKILFGEIGDAAEAERLANELLGLLAEPIVIGDKSIRMRICIGLATWPQDGHDLAELRSRARTAMLEASRLGVSKVCPFLPEYAAAEVKDLRIMTAMEEMLEADAFEVHYQPVCRPDGAICGLEALLRMHHPTLGDVSPSVFIPVAEESGFIIPLGDWVLKRVCMQMNRWKQQGLPLVPVAVNISGLQFRQSDFASRILDTLNAFGIPSHLLRLELTESTVLRNISDALEEMQKLSANGLQFSIDDFGTGYSSLGRLQEMPISTLKIDRSFVRGITQPTSLVVAAIISLAHALGMKVIAEGVEKHEELEVLRCLNCDLIQGYIFARPLSPRVLEPLLQSGSCIPSESLTLH